MEYPYAPPAQAASQSERNVDQLLASLSATQLLYARKQLQDFTALWNGFSSFPDLPPEVHLIISDLLDLPDVFSCRAVDRAWRNTWKSPALLHSLCRKFFEGLIELTPVGVDLDVLFLRAANKRLRRLLGPMHHVSLSCGYKPHTLLYQDRMLVYRAYDEEIWPIKQLCIPGDKSKCACEDGEKFKAVYEPHSRDRLNFTDRALQGYHDRVVGISGDLIALYEYGLPFGGHQERRLRVWHRRLNAMEEMSLPGPIDKAYVHQESVITFLEYGNSVLLYQWGGVLRDVPVVTKYFPRDDEADKKPHLKLGSAQIDWDYPHKPIRLGPSVMYHPADRNVFYLAWRYRQTSTYCAVSSLEIVKYVNNQPVQHFFKNDIRDLMLDQPGLDAGSRHCQGFQDHITYVQFGCEPVSEFGLFAVFVQGAPPFSIHDGHAMSECPRCGDQIDQWRAICFNVCTETFSELNYRSLSSSKEREQPGGWILHEPFRKCTVRIWGPELWVENLAMMDKPPNIYAKRYIEEKSVGLVPLTGVVERDPANPLELGRVIEEHCDFNFSREGFPDEIFVDADVMVMVYGPDEVLVFNWEKSDVWEERPLWPWEEER